jgi:predicted dienelactone hydrolase
MTRRFPALLLVLSLCGAACGSDVDSSNNDGQLTDTGQLADASGDAGDALGDVLSEDASDAENLLTIPERPWPVDEQGPYNVGYTQREITYDAQGTDEPRTIRLAIWYPTRDLGGARSLYYDLLSRREAFSNATVGIDEPAPLLVFSHGNSSLAEQSFFMTEFFASHGWIVASPDHTGNTVRDTQGAIDLTSAVFRSQDISQVIDFMLAPPGDDPLSEMVSNEDIVMSGHSFGAVTTLASSGAEFAVDELLAECQAAENPSDMCEIFDGREDWTALFRDGFNDERIKVAIPQSPGGYEAFREGISAIETPTLMFTGSMDRTLPNEEEGDPIWQEMQGAEHMRVDLEKGGHFTFSNMCSLLGGVEMIDNDGCNDEFIDIEIAFEIINAYSLAFSRYHLFDDHTDADLVEGPTPYEGVEISRKDAP